MAGDQARAWGGPMRRRVGAVALLAIACGPPRAEPRSPAPAVAIASPTPACPGDAGSLAACVERSRLDDDLVRIVGARPPGSIHHREVMRLCADTFAAAGYEVEMHGFDGGTNVIASAPGTRDETVVVGAHYDHIAGCDGADDNASGVAAVLELARVLAHRPHARGLVLACWDDEESGLRGSRAWVAANAGDRPIAIAYQFDAVGIARHAPDTQTIPAGFELVFPAAVAALQARERRGDFVAIVADRAAEAAAARLGAAADALALPQVVLAIDRIWVHLPVVIDLRRSDHAAFWDAGIPAILVTDTAEFRTPSYHCRGGPDRLEGLDGDFLRRVTAASAVAIATSLDETPPSE